MSVLLLSGLPGAGKSYLATALAVVPGLELGRPIWTNVPLAVQELQERYPGCSIRQFTSDEARVGELFADVPGGALVVVDEVGTIWPSGQKASNDPSIKDRASYAPLQAVEFLATHRHIAAQIGDKLLSCEVVLISQSSSDLAKWCRTRVDKTYVVTKLDAVGGSGRYRCEIYQGLVDTQRPRSDAMIRRYFGTYEDRFTSLYRSHTKTASVEGISVSELKADKGATAWTPYRIAALVAGPVLLIAAALMVPDMLFASQRKAAEAKPAKVDVQPALVKLEAGKVSVVEVIPEDSVEWRITGTGGSPGKWVVIAQSVSGGKIRIPPTACKRPQARDVECQYQGERISRYTGLGSASGTAYVPGAQVSVR
jgi:zona occludens toxin